MHRFRPADFSPAPAVDVVLLRLQKRAVPSLEPTAAEGYGDFVTYLFSAWKPTLRDVLRGLVSTRQLARLEDDIGQSLALAPGDLPGEAWIALYRAMRANAGKSLEQVTGARAKLERQQAVLQKEHRTRNARQQSRNGKAR